MGNTIDTEKIRWFADNNSGEQVWKSWRDNMLKQGREVAEERMAWDTLPEQDKELDKNIAYEVLLDFVIWYEGHPHERLGLREEE